MPKPTKTTLGRPKLADPRQLIHARVAGETWRKLDRKCRLGGLALGRLLDQLAESLP